MDTCRCRRSVSCIPALSFLLARLQYAICRCCTPGACPEARWLTRQSRMVRLEEDSLCGSCCSVDVQRCCCTCGCSFGPALLADAPLSSSLSALLTGHQSRGQVAGLSVTCPRGRRRTEPVWRYAGCACIAWLFTLPEAIGLRLLHVIETGRQRIV